MKEAKLYKVTLKSNCYKSGIDINIIGDSLEEAISKAKKHLEEDIDNIDIEIISATKIMENVIVYV